MRKYENEGANNFDAGLFVAIIIIVFLFVVVLCYGCAPEVPNK